MSDYKPINLAEKFGKFTEQWSPRVVAEMNDYQFKLSKLQGEFIWHSHPETDEVFLVVHGSMTIEFRDGRVDLKAGEMFVVPRGVEHKPVAASECQLMIIEPRGVANTGDAGGERTAKNDVWV
jgi:mannose-6-phosphate isomerase-like protein (cupin superfamily)